MENEAESLAADVALRRLATEQPNVETARKAADASPDDLQRQLDLAQALAGAEQFEEALKIALNLVRRDRQGIGETARQMMVQIFHRLGEEHDLTSDYQRKLSAALS
jgi:putative thioredoxin